MLSFGINYSYTNICIISKLNIVEDHVNNDYQFTGKIAILQETGARLLFMLSQDFFATTRLYRVHKNFFCRSVQYNIWYHLKSNKIIGQRKTTNTEKHFFSGLISFNLKLSCTQLILVNSKDLLQILYIYCTN